MQELLFETVFIAILILLNGYLAGTEIAVVTARKSHIKEMAESGNKNAQIFLKLKEEPDRFLATIQIGITTDGGLASAVGGVAAGTGFSRRHRGAAPTGDGGRGWRREERARADRSGSES